MKKNKLYTILLLVCSVFCLLFCGCNINSYTPPETTTVKQRDPTRENFDHGSCYDMTDDVCYLVVFLDDEESQWSADEKEKFLNKKLQPSLNFLSERALEYDITLNHKYEIYPKVENSSLNFSGVIDPDVVVNGKQENILDEISKSMGYASPKQMDRVLRNEFDVRQIAYLIVLNKNGRSYKYSHVISNAEKYEFCVFFDDAITYSGDTCISTIAHEILHLFGAEDYYDPYGQYPEREKLAQELYPDDIMNETFFNINEAQIGAYTAYSVGWTDEMPEECNVPEWWG